MTDATEMAWDGLIKKDINTFSRGFADSFSAQVNMFQKMMNEKIVKVIDSHRNKAKAWKLSGAGEGGYLIFVSELEIPNVISVKIRRKVYWI